MDDDLLTAAQVAALLGITLRSVGNARRRGALRYAQRVEAGGQRIYKYRRADVEEYARQKKTWRSKMHQDWPDLEEARRREREAAEEARREREWRPHRASNEEIASRVYADFGVEIDTETAAAIREAAHEARLVWRAGERLTIVGRNALNIWPGRVQRG